MYFPILRGRQFELLALRECINNNILSSKIIPIVEPVKVSSTYTKTIDTFIAKKHPIAIIRNPRVGSWVKDIKKESNQSIKTIAVEQLKEDTVISSLYITSKFESHIEHVLSHGYELEKMLLICNNSDYVDLYEQVVGDRKPLYNVIPDKGEFRRRIRPNRIMCEDHFPKQHRNIDYPDEETELFSKDHLYYQDDGFKGFSDYSVVGAEYSETGFAPYAVAIHIVYFDENNALRIAHFVSDSNDDISDPARKFAEAVEKLVKWNETMQLDTIGIRAFEEAFRNKTYPGLGVVKKYSIMHHLELMSRYLDEEHK
ncbi:MAG: sce7725 family protein [Oscillospiraceae bacterium]|nr:sce7725 family protein [Oscillospiraceae bacterium]